MPEYWVVDPVHQVVSVYLLENGKYAPPLEYGREDMLPVVVLKGLEIDLSDVFEPLEAHEDEEGVERL